MMWKITMVSALVFWLLFLPARCLLEAETSTPGVPQNNTSIPPAYVSRLDLDELTVRLRHAVEDDAGHTLLIRLLGGEVTYGAPVNDLNVGDRLQNWHASWVKAQINYPILRLRGIVGKNAYSEFWPPGTIQGEDDRGHLHANSLGGDGRTVKNIVAMNRDLNNRQISFYEQMVANIYQSMYVFCYIQYKTTARYEDPLSQRPTTIEIDVKVYHPSTPDQKTDYMNLLFTNVPAGQVPGAGDQESPNRLLRDNSPRTLPPECLPQPISHVAIGKKDISAAAVFLTQLNIHIRNPSCGVN